jgi:hypothetical protein
VFGTSTPPSGLSGAIRRTAFRYSESSYDHWLPLMLADRVSVVEGLLEVLKNGRVPNVFAEGCWKAEWEHNKTGLARRVLVRGVLISAAVAYLRSRRADSPERNAPRLDHAGLTFATSHQGGPQHSGHFSYTLPATLVRNAAKGGHGPDVCAMKPKATLKHRLCLTLI